MMKLSDREWKEFKLEDIFHVELSKGDNKPNHLVKGNTPLISSGDSNNGIVKFVIKGDEKSQKFSKDKLTFDMFGKIFYHPYEFYSVSHGRINILSAKVNISSFTLMFLIVVLEKSSKNIFSYNRMASSKRIKKLKFKIPITNQNTPDYNFMEQYIKEKYFNLKSQIKEKQKHEITDWRGLDEVEWMDFQINKLFYNKIGKNIDGNKIDKQNGKVPYVTRKESNNGLDGFIYNDKRIEEKLNISQNPVITIGNETAKPFVQNYDFFTGTKVNILQPIATNNIFSLRFISKMLEQQKKKYSYSFTINSRRLKKQTIKLPTKNNQPDYKFMEQYMKRKENEVLERI
ncbi:MULTISPECIES: restriction endonuclease subunit S [Staphylococcus]|uniref:restriction endonuclease subunit S n=1 Tax=Staphylococcus TaxID=1279 RepID=UPI002DB87950|nr:restriction endonuclease subunit S [Staphylococcus epidermidis]MEB7398449.1 restriction endonuclease subunit S [Staphylococcus epidermidis]